MSGPWENYQPQATAPVVGPWMNYAEPSEQPGIATRIGNDWNNIDAQQQAAADRYGAGDQGQAHTYAQIAGDELGKAGSVGNELARSAINGISAITPDPIFGNSTAQNREAIANSAPGQFVSRQLAKAGDFIGSEAQAHPVIAGDVQAGMNALNGVGALYGMGQGAGLMKDAASAVLKPVVNSGAALATKLLPDVDEETARLAQMAGDKYNIPLSLQNVTNSPTMNNIQKISRDLPFSGVSQDTSAQAAAINRAVTRTWGNESPTVTQKTVSDTLDHFNKAYGAIYKDKVMAVTPEDVAHLDGILEDSKGALDVGLRPALEENINKIKDNIASNGTISGDILGNIRSQISTNIKNADPALQPHLRDVMGKLLDITAQGDPETVANIQNVNGQYRNFMASLPAAAKATRGNINPLLLENSVNRTFGRAYAAGKAGDVGDISKIAKTFLPLQTGSDTASKLEYLAGAGAILHNPMYAAPIGTALGANRLYQAGFNTSPAALAAYLARQGVR